MSIATAAAMGAAILVTIGVAGPVAEAVVTLVVRSERFAPAPPAVLRAEAAYRAAYVAHAAVRVQNSVSQGSTLPESLRKELPYLQMHLAAQRKRREAWALAHRVGRWTTAQNAYGPAAPPGTRGSVLLAGWKAVMDRRTSPECIAANGHNFLVDTPPVFGYPGTVHLHCRCIAVPPYPGASVLPSLMVPLPHH